MLKENFKEILIRDLNLLKTEIESYRDETGLWIVHQGTNNSVGNLCMHLTGNLRHFIGAVLGKTGYIRNRESEFSAKNIPRTELLKSIDETVDVVDKTLSSLPEEDLKKIYPIEYSNKRITTESLLLHCISHFNYHLGQINYHRRIIGL